MAFYFLQAQRYTGLPLRAVKPFGCVLAPKRYWEAIPVPLKTSPSDKCKNKMPYSLLCVPGLLKNAETQG